SVVNVYYDHDTTPVTPDDPQKPGQPTSLQPTTPTKPTDQNETTITNTLKPKESTTNESRSLPTTGDETNNLLGTLGAILLSLLSVLTFGYVTKTKKER
ncbi:LPXTG cell wall anchor domain-containing protein, partial [Lacticaseibacillus paracasei]|uniref:LPXTG cell wall anchor domain-containing protein n=1 Tax=Lacticaseibacillus paracasei TaxID=1597 RepID=UPI0010AE5323